MLKIEARLATLIRRTVGRSARVILGNPQMPRNEKALSRPHIFVQMNQFCDTTYETKEQSYMARRVVTEGNLQGFREERPGHVTVQVEILGDDYCEAQELRQKLVGAVLVYLDTVREIPFSDPRDGNVEMLFRDIIPSLSDFGINGISGPESPFYCAQLHFVLNGFMHLCVMHKKPKKRAATRKKST